MIPGRCEKQSHTFVDGTSALHLLENDARTMRKSCDGMDPQRHFHFKESVHDHVLHPEAAHSSLKKVVNTRRSSATRRLSACFCSMRLPASFQLRNHRTDAGAALRAGQHMSAHGACARELRCKREGAPRRFGRTHRSISIHIDQNLGTNL